MSFLRRLQNSLEPLYQLPEHSHYVVAYSGGVDSHVLLHCCQQLNLPLRAVHVHHGLQAVADDWVRHCQAVCDELAIELDVLYVDASVQQGYSPEEIARKVRYGAIAKNLKTGDCLLTAQHENDQAETLLLQLFRTASAAGLAAMPALKKLEAAVHIRPFLSFTREEILHYAKAQDLLWVEDPTNQDSGISRNFIRNEVLPILQARWPDVIAQLSTAASLQSSNLQVLEDMAAVDLARLVICDNGGQSRRADSGSAYSAYRVESQLSISGLQSLSSARVLNVLRLWIIRMAKKQPSRNLLGEIERTLVNAAQDAESVVKFERFEFRKYHNRLYLLIPALSAGRAKVYDWCPRQALQIQALDLQLSASYATEKNNKNTLLAEALSYETLKVRFREGGERFHPAGRGHSQSLKKLFQEAAIPSWERDTMPLIYLDDDLIAVGDLWVAKAFSVSPDEAGWSIQLSRITG
jgi:tRNA(Ile)-lysidine synthase